MAWWKEVLNLLKKVPKVISKGFIKGTVTEVSMDNVISLASKAGKTVTSVTNDLGQCVGFGSVSSTSVNGAACEVIELFEVTTTEVAAEAGAVTLAGESLAAGEVATEVAIAETGVGVGATALSVAGVAILAALGCYLIYQENPEYWNGVGEKLLEPGQTIGGKIITFFDSDGNSYYSDETISIVRQMAFENNLIRSDAISQGDYNGQDYNYTTKRTTFSSIELYGIHFKERNHPTWDAIPTYISASTKFSLAALYNDEHLIFYAIIDSFNYENDSFNFTNYDTYDIYDGDVKKYTIMPFIWGDLNGTIYDHIYYYTDEFVNNLKYLFRYNDMYVYHGNEDNDEAHCLYLANAINNFEEENKDVPIEKPLREPVEFPDAIPAKKRTVHPIEIPSQLDETSKDSDFDTRPDKEKPTISDDPNNASDRDTDTGKITNPVPNPVPAPAPQPEIKDPNENKNDDKGGTPVIAPELPISASAVSRVFNLSQSELDSLGSYLWSSTSVEDLKKLFQSPLDGVISLHKIYGTPTTGDRKNIKLGYIDTNVSALEVTSQFITIDCGTVSVPLQYNNATDYPPYTDVQIYLPFIGIQTLNAYDIINSQLACKYRIDVYTGACIAMLTVIRGNLSAKLYEFSGSCCYQLPLTSGNYMQLLANTVTGAVIGGAKGGLGGAIMGGAGAMLHSNVDIARSGNLSQNAGILGSRKPYLIITKTDAYDAADYNTLYGYPCNKTVYLKNCKGYTRVKDIKLHTSATQEEKDEIEKLLKGGVII